MAWLLSLARRPSRYPFSVEINLKVADTAKSREGVQEEYRSGATSAIRLDSLGMESGSWQSNLQRSNTEPLMRLNLGGHVKGRMQ